MLQLLDMFLPLEASIELEVIASEDTSVIVPNFSFTIADPETGSQPKQVYPLSAMSEEIQVQSFWTYKVLL